MEERRAEVRMLCADVVEVSWRERGHARTGTGLLEDISPSGACLQLDTPAPVGTNMRWHAAGLLLTNRDLKELVRAFLHIRSEQLDAIAAGSGRAEC